MDLICSENARHALPSTGPCADAAGDGVVLVGHGRSDAYAIKNAILLTARTVENGVLEAIKRGIAPGDSAAADQNV